MTLIVIMLFGQVVAVQGPLDEFLDDDSCAALIAEYRTATIDAAPDGVAADDGRIVTVDDVSFDCVWSVDRPEITGP